MKHISAIISSLTVALAMHSVNAQEIDGGTSFHTETTTTYDTYDDGDLVWSSSTFRGEVRVWDNVSEEILPENEWVATIQCRMFNDSLGLYSNSTSSFFTLSIPYANGNYLAQIGDTVSFNFESGTVTRTFEEHSDVAWWFHVVDTDEQGGTANIIYDSELFRTIAEELFEYGKVPVEVTLEEDGTTIDDAGWFALPEPHPGSEIATVLSQCLQARNIKQAEQDDNEESVFSTSENLSLSHTRLIDQMVESIVVIGISDDQQAKDALRKVQKLIEETLRPKPTH